MKHHLMSSKNQTGLTSKSVLMGRNERQTKASTTGSVLALAALLPLVALTGCASYSKDNFTVGSVHDTYKTKHPIVINEQEQTLDVPIGSGSHDLSFASLGAIEGFAYRFRKSASGNITIMLPAGSPNEASARSALSKVINAVQTSGIPRNKISTVTYYAAEHGSSAPIRLSYVAVRANVGGCGQWPDDLANSNSQNHNYHNFGCASQNNMASMIANPADLLGPRGMSPIDPTKRVKSLQDYQKDRIRIPTSSGF